MPRGVVGGWLELIAWGDPAVHRQGRDEPSGPSLSEQREQSVFKRERQLFAGAALQKTR